MKIIVSCLYQCDYNYIVTEVTSEKNLAQILKGVTSYEELHIAFEGDWSFFRESDEILDFAMESGLQMYMVHPGENSPSKLLRCVDRDLVPVPGCFSLNPGIGKESSMEYHTEAELTEIEGTGLYIKDGLELVDEEMLSVNIFTEGATRHDMEQWARGYTAAKDVFFEAGKAAGAESMRNAVLKALGLANTLDDMQGNIYTIAASLFHNGIARQDMGSIMGRE